MNLMICNLKLGSLKIIFISCCFCVLQALITASKDTDQRKLLFLFGSVMRPTDTSLQEISYYENERLVLALELLHWYFS